MKIVFMGTPDFAVPTLAALVEKGHDICAVFTQPDKPKGRGYKLTPPPVKEMAIKHGIKVFQPQSLKKGEDAEAALQKISELNPDIIVVVAYGKLLPKAILDIPKLCCVNVHGSLLPKYRGSAPIQWSVLNGDKTTGVTTMLMAEGLDTGDMLMKSETEISENETASQLYERLSKIGAELLIKTVDLLEKGEIIPEKQDDLLSSYAPMLSKELCPIDFSKSAQEVHNQIRGLSEWPCATTILDGKKLKFYKSEISEFEKLHEICGEILDEKHFIVACKNGSIKILEVQAEGSKRMSAVDFLRGKPVKKGTILK